MKDFDEPNKGYRWSSVYEWFLWKVDHNEFGGRELLQLLVYVDPDKIQDLWQNEMKEDGYFEFFTGNICEECGLNIIQTEPHYKCPECKCYLHEVCLPEEHGMCLGCYDLAVFEGRFE